MKPAGPCGHLREGLKAAGNLAEVLSERLERQLAALAIAFAQDG